jgi:hypothetical protein
LNTFKAELRKIGILLGAGVGLLIVIDLYMSIKGSQNIISQLLDPSLIIWSMFWILYPVGVVYGWDKIKAMWHGVKREDRMGEFQNIGNNSFMVKVTRVVAAIIFSLIVGPIIGVVKAIITLKKVKGANN